jgi:23S rRNA G2445 N2-methylase RlmL
MSQHPEDDPERPYFATAARGTEGALRAELTELRVPRVKATRGGVYFGGELRDALAVCLHSRIVLRVLSRESSFQARDRDELYAGVRAIPFERVLDTGRTLCVDAHVRSAPITNSAYAAMRVKDAVVDRLRDLHGARPSVDKRDPDVRIVLHWNARRASVLLDLSASSLHARGYRSEAGEAPMRETLAAAIVRLSGWDMQLPLLDPMCGSGTLLIEAAQRARGIAPNVERRLGCERWLSHGPAEQQLLAELRERARGRAAANTAAPAIEGRDRDGRVLELARRNAERAGVSIAFERAEVARLERRHERGFVITNPPYGERLAAPAEQGRELAQVFRKLRGHRVCVFAHDRTLLRAMPMRPSLEHALWNGPLECRLLCWDID